MTRYNVVRVIGETKRIFRGTERRDRIRFNGVILKGYVRVRHQNGEETVDTCFLHRKEGVVQVVPGFDWAWLARRNNRTIKAAA